MKSSTKNRTDGYPSDYELPDDSVFPIRWSQFTKSLPHPRRNDDVVVDVSPSPLDIILGSMWVTLLFLVLSLLFFSWILLTMTVLFYLNDVQKLRRRSAELVSDGFILRSSVPAVDWFCMRSDFVKFSDVAVFHNPDPVVEDLAEDEVPIDDVDVVDGADEPYVLPFLAS